MQKKGDNFLYTLPLAFMLTNVYNISNRTRRASGCIVIYAYHGGSFVLVGDLLCIQILLSHSKRTKSNYLY